MVSLGMRGDKTVSSMRGCENLKSLRTMFWCVRVFWLGNFVGKVSVKALKCLRNWVFA